MVVERCTPAWLDDWARLRQALWPELDLSMHRAEAETWLAEGDRTIAFLARDGEAAVGFAEASLRRDHVNGCGTSPVAFLEGIYVRPDSRDQGVARRLVEAVQRWAAERGCTELASDTDIANEASQRMHEALGFEETERVVFYRKALAAP